MIGISLAEYDRRWDAIMVAFQTGRLSPREASSAIRELTSQIIWK